MAEASWPELNTKQYAICSMGPGIMSPTGSSLTYVLVLLWQTFTHIFYPDTHQMWTLIPGRLRARVTRSLAFVFIEIRLVLDVNIEQCSH